MTELYIQYGPAVAAAIFIGLAWLYSRFLADRIKNTRVGEMIAAAGQELRAVITEVHNTYVEALKAANEDGKLTDEERAKAKKMAIAKFKENWGIKGIKRMTKVLGIGGSVDSWLGTQVEATLSDMKDAAKLPKATALPPKE
jgi:hypothetical protein